MTTNSLNNECLNDFTVTSATSGTTRTLTVSNTSNTASSTASKKVSVAGTSAGDPYHLWEVASTVQYALGIDNSDSDIFKMTTDTSSTTPSSSTVFFQSTTAGNVRLSATPMFRCYLASTATNVTGDGTYYKIAFDTENYDVQNNFDAATNFVFTAPVAGKYIFNTLITLTDLASLTTIELKFFINDMDTDSTCVNGITDFSSAGFGSLTLFSIIDLAVNDTVETGFTGNGSTKIVDMVGGNELTYFCGFLLG